jgi:hypothetical protein
VANLQSTYANNAKLQITFPESLKLEQSTGNAVDVLSPVHFRRGGIEQTEITIALGNIQYGQSRDIYLRYAEKPHFGPGPGPDTAIAEKEESDEDMEVVDEKSDEFEIVEKPASKPDALTMTAKLTYQRMTSFQHTATAIQDLTEPTTSMSDSEIAYHVSRSAIIEFIANLFPLRWDHEHEAITYSNDNALKLQDLIRTLPCAKLARADPQAKFVPSGAAVDDPPNASLMQDLLGASPHGQISLALSKDEYWRRWGVHYLPSLAGAHARQLCNSFKDPGPLQYGAGCELFRRCRDQLDDIFDNLPPPVPSNLYPDPFAGQMALAAAYGAAGSVPSYAASAPAPFSMTRYNRSSNPCFAGFCAVRLAGGASLPLGRLRAGMAVVTPRGTARVVAVLKTRVHRERMVRLDGGLVVTPWHPVRRPGAARWAFPGGLAEKHVRYTGSIYSVLLERNADVDAHAVLVEGVWGVTLGHGLLTRPAGDVRGHQFLGDYRRVALSLISLGVTGGGIVLGGGVRRDPKTGLVCGFQPPARDASHARREARRQATSKTVLRTRKLL